MITCHIRYEIDPKLVQTFERYAKMWIPLVQKYGGIHHGYFLPHEGRDYEAYAMFSFPSLAEYEEYRTKIKDDPECQAAFDFANEHHCIKKIDRQFMRPILTDTDE